MQERIDGLNEKHKTMEERDQTYKEYQENKKKLKGLAEEQYLRQINPKTEYLAMHPRFSADFSRLAYIGRDEQFLSHSANYQLKMMNWP